MNIYLLNKLMKLSLTLFICFFFLLVCQIDYSLNAKKSNLKTSLLKDLTTNHHITIYDKTKPSSNVKNHLISAKCDDLKISFSKVVVDTENKTLEAKKVKVHYSCTGLESASKKTTDGEEIKSIIFEYSGTAAPGNTVTLTNAKIVSPFTAGVLESNVIFFQSDELLFYLKDKIGKKEDVKVVFPSDDEKKKKIKF